ncbi:UvrD-helicase domain-containing protein [Flammeovirga kamogawensis]|uniref:DNA 3'-5' helicase n=1 Tax=Flammeovirga kamogawensis TaxID=373891 RepID=A0ABX8GVD3_9BACT|nr:UvrD-helicase domain-containing protein [Flammeovirga kamogawensis]MBB6464039.1 ATP-dependent exoDNAse (exonuclease V) beta subunit [Flammeovirga kamogawensis]QWG07369.1 UvrD-helicase domain-containing protein [Flammeovirga kamogawensis]TRX69184.1 AAA family ATPase [Flammeovirga kamogawensis]
MFKIYRSSAGAGKTFTLAKEYIKIVLQLDVFDEEFQPSYYKHVLAVTFTNLATSEMKERILEQLKIFAGKPSPNDEGMLGAIVADYKGMDEKIVLDRIYQRSSIVHQRILHGYSNFSVSTIDAFSQKVAQAFKRDLKFPFNYELILNGEELIEDATYILMDKLGRDEHKMLTEALETFSIKKAEENASWNIVPQIKSFGSVLFDEDQRKIIGKLGVNPVTNVEMNIEDYTSLAKKLKKMIYQDLQKEKDDAYEEFKNSMSAAGVPIDSLSRYVCSYAKKFDGPITEIDVTPNATAIKVFEGETGKVLTKVADYKSSPAIYDAALPIYQERLSELRTLIAKAQLIKTVYDKIYLIITAQVLKDEMKNLKEEQGIVHISEIGENINKIVETSPVPYLYERLGEKYRHILIDEFQDTSKTQWHNLVPLVAHALSMYNGECLVVGDAKQSIYRWRGGKAEMLVALPKLPTAKNTALEEEEYTLESYADPQNLDTNWRSYSNVINFNNDLYSFIEKNKGDTLLSQFYQDVAQKTNHRIGGQVRMSVCQKVDSKETVQEASLQKIADTIHELVELRKFQLSDIAILIRFNKDGSAIAEKLVSEGIEVISSESLLVESAPSIQFLANVIRLLVRRSDKILFMKIARFVHAHLQDVNNDRWSEVNTSSLPIEGDDYIRIGDRVEACTNHKDFETFLKDEFDITFSVSQLRRKSLYDLVEFLVRNFKLNLRITEQAYLIKFLDFVLDHTEVNGNSAQDFLVRWDLKRTNLSISTPDNTNAVRILSIHKSKGLEFPVVLLPFADWSTLPRKNEAKWFDWENNTDVPELNAVQLPLNKKLEGTAFEEGYLLELRDTYIDAVNMLYVGTTRAQKYLHLFFNEEAKVNAKGVKTETKDTIAVPLLKYISSNDATRELESTTIDDIEFNEYELFDIDVEGNEKEKANEVSLLRDLIHTDNTDKLRLKSGAYEQGQNTVSFEDIIEAQESGILVHKAFEYIKYKDDVHDAVRILEVNGFISSSETGDYIGRLIDVVNHPELERYYDKNTGYEVLNESEIVFPTKGNMKQVKVDRPDRLLIKDKEAVIIDYKTGVYEKDHEKQIKRYGEALKGMGYTIITLLLIYTEDLDIKKINF